MLSTVWIQNCSHRDVTDMRQHSPGFSGIKNVIQVSGIIKCLQTRILSDALVDGQAGGRSCIRRLPHRAASAFHIYSTLTPEHGVGCLVSSDETDVLSRSSLVLLMWNVTELQIFFFFFLKKVNMTQQQPTIKPTGGGPATTLLLSNLIPAD